MDSTEKRLVKFFLWFVVVSVTIFALCVCALFVSNFLPRDPVGAISEILPTRAPTSLPTPGPKPTPTQLAERTSDAISSIVDVLTWGTPLLILGVAFIVIVFATHIRTKDKKRLRMARITSSGWGEFESSVINYRVEMGMTQEMVVEAWGMPDNVDQQQETEKYKQERWVYGTPRKGSGANYVTFRNGVVTKKLINFSMQPSTGLGTPGLIAILLVVWVLCGIIIMVNA